MDEKDIRLMVEVCKRYYQDGLGQSEIAKEFFCSRSQISKILSRAKKCNIVNIQINDPFSEEINLEKKIQERYHIKKVLITDTESENEKAQLEEIAKRMSVLFSHYIANGNTIGVSGGYAVLACSMYTTIYNCKNLKFIPLIAGQSFKGEKWYANQNCERFASRFRSEYVLLNTPFVIREDNLRKQLCENAVVRPVLNAYDSLDVILLGIGETFPDSTLGQCEFSSDEIKWAYEHGAKAIIGASFLDAGGNEMMKAQSEMLIGIKAAQIKKCSRVIGVAIGSQKKEAIKAVLKGEYLDVLCTDSVTAKALLD